MVIKIHLVVKMAIEVMIIMIEVIIMRIIMAKYDVFSGGIMVMLDADTVCNSDC